MGSKGTKSPASSAGSARRSRGPGGGLRAALRLAAALAMHAALALAVRFGLSRLFPALFGAWNLNAATLFRAPGWARLLYRWHGSLITLAADALSIALSILLCRRWALRDDANDNRGCGIAWRFCLSGLGAALCAAALFLALDSLRLEWPLARPRLTFGLIPLLILSLVTVLAEEWFTKHVVYALAREAWGPVIATLAATAAFFFTNGGFAGNAWCAVNVILLGLLCCRIYARYGFAAAVGLRWGWSVAMTFMLGFGGGAHAVYRLYGVSETLLTGGDAGFMYGLWPALAMGTALFALDRETIARRFRKR